MPATSSGDRGGGARPGQRETLRTHLSEVAAVALGLREALGHPAAGQGVADGGQGPALREDHAGELAGALAEYLRGGAQ